MCRVSNSSETHWSVLTGWAALNLPRRGWGCGIVGSRRGSWPDAGSVASSHHPRQAEDLTPEKIGAAKRKTFANMEDIMNAFEERLGNTLATRVLRQLELQTCSGMHVAGCCSHPSPKTATASQGTCGCSSGFGLMCIFMSAHCRA